MEKYKVVMSNQAEKELSNIITYISQVLLEPNIAKNLLKKLTLAINNLENFPEKYSIISEDYTIQENIRKCIVDNYIIVYRINYELLQVEISHIFYAKRNWMKLI